LRSPQRLIDDESSRQRLLQLVQTATNRVNDLAATAAAEGSARCDCHYSYCVPELRIYSHCMRRPLHDRSSRPSPPSPLLRVCVAGVGDRPIVSTSMQSVQSQLKQLRNLLLTPCDSKLAGESVNDVLAVVDVRDGVLVQRPPLIAASLLDAILPLWPLWECVD
jgi:hypothetical protein